MAEIVPAGESVSQLLGSNILWVKTKISSWEQQLNRLQKSKVYRYLFRRS